MEIQGELLVACSKRVAVEIVMGRGLDREEALEFLEFNTFCVGGEGMPIWIDDLE